MGKNKKIIYLCLSIFIITLFALFIFNKDFLFLPTVQTKAEQKLISQNQVHISVFHKKATPIAGTEPNAKNCHSTQLIKLSDSLDSVQALQEFLRHWDCQPFSGISSLEPKFNGNFTHNEQGKKINSISGTIAQAYRHGAQVSWHGKSLNIRPLQGRNSPAELINGTVVFREISPGVSSVWTAADHQLEEFLLVNRGSEIPSLKYDVQLPNWVTRIRQTEVGSIEFWDEETAWLRAAAPEAMDERGWTYRGRAYVEGLGAGNPIPSGQEWRISQQNIQLNFIIPGLPSTKQTALVIDPGWQNTNYLNVKRLYPTATLLQNGKVLIAGGLQRLNLLDAYNRIIPNIEAERSCELFNPQTSTFTFTGSMKIPRSWHRAEPFNINSKVLVMGGITIADQYDGRFTESAEIYDSSSGMWSDAAVMHTKRANFSSTWIDYDKLLVAGGKDYNQPDPGNGRGLRASTAKAEIYDVRTNIWTPVASMLQARAAHAAALISLPNGSKRILVAGGTLVATDYLPPDLAGSNNIALNSSEVFDPSLNRWSATGSLITGRAYGVFVNLSSSQVLFGGGFNTFGTNNTLTTSEIYNSASGSWQAVPSPMPYASMTTAAIKLLSGKIMVTGSQHDNFDSRDAIPNSDWSPTKKTQFFNPVSGSWDAGPDMASVRWGHASVLLADGRLMVVGGTAIGPSYVNIYGLNTAEIYTPPPLNVDLAIMTARSVMSGTNINYSVDVRNNGPTQLPGGYFKLFLNNSLGFGNSSPLASGGITTISFSLPANSPVSTACLVITVPTFTDPVSNNNCVGNWLH